MSLQFLFPSSFSFSFFFHQANQKIFQRPGLAVSIYFLYLLCCTYYAHILLQYTVRRHLEKILWSHTAPPMCVHYTVQDFPKKFHSLIYGKEIMKAIKTIKHTAMNFVEKLPSKSYVFSLDLNNNNNNSSGRNLYFESVKTKFSFTL